MAAGVSSVLGNQASAADAPARLFRVYADPEGESHLEELAFGKNLGTVPVTGFTILDYQPMKNDWHTAPGLRFALNIVGDLEVETSAGGKYMIGPKDLVFLEDTFGKGHVTKIVTPVFAMFISVADGFDVRKWAQGQGERS